MKRDQEYWTELFTQLGAFWRHDGNLTHPHALLTKGGHSDGFHNWSVVAQHPRIAREVAENIFMNFYGTTSADTIKSIVRVIGPGTGAITLADRIAEAFPNNCMSGYTEKTDEGQVLARFSCTGEIVIPCEDTITSGGSVTSTIAAIEAGGGKVADFILAVCNRSGQKEIGGRRIVALIDVPMQNWSPDDCPLCKRGSEAIRPKKENWLRLTQPQ